MAILKGEITIIESEEDVVYSEDPDVTPAANRLGCGWILASDAQVNKGADVVKIKALTPANRGKYRGVLAQMGSGEANRFAAHRGVLKINGKGGAAVTKWVDALAQQNAMALDLLGDRINQLAMGQPMEALYAKARSCLGVEVVDEDAASKSAGE